MSDQQYDLRSFGVQTASDYDEMVDWAKRLLRESGFFRDLFHLHRVQRLVDVGCGTGKHALMFASWGLDVVGVDPSMPMLEQARINAASEGSSVPFLEGSFGHLGEVVEGPFDAVLTLGNALPHVAGIEGLRETFSDFERLLRPGGIVVLHLLNHDRLIATKPRMLPAFVRETKEGERIYIKILKYAEDHIDFEFITLTRGAADTWETQSRRSQHTLLPSHVLREELDHAGFAEPMMYGDHYGKRFDPESDESVIVVAVKRRGEIA